MEPLKIVDNFFETTSLARQIDEGVQYLEAKLGNVKSFGLSVNPEQTRIIAKNKLEKINNEINEYKVSDKQNSFLRKSIQQSNWYSNRTILRTKLTRW